MYSFENFENMKERKRKLKTISISIKIIIININKTSAVNCTMYKSIPS